VINSQLLLLSNTAISQGLEDIKWRLANSPEEVKIAALKEALNYGKEGVKLVAKVVKTEKGLVQLIAYDLLWEKTNSRGKQKLLKYLSRYPEVAANYIETILEPSLTDMQQEQEQRRQVLGQACNTEEFIKQRYKQALLGVYRREESDRDRSIPDLVIDRLPPRQNEQTLTKSELNDYPIENPVSSIVRDNVENPAHSEPMAAKTLQEAIALIDQLTQQTTLVKNLLPDLVLISKLFEAKAKKHLVEAQTFTNTIQQIEKALLQIEGQWQELESIANEEKLPLKLLQLLDSLILQMQKHLMLLRQTVARAITTRLQIQHHYNLAEKAATYCKYRAKLDWQEGNENWARESLARRKIYVDTATILKFGLEQQTPQLEVFKCHLFVLQTWLSLATQMKNTLKVETSSARIQEAQALLQCRIEFPYNTSGIMTKLERIKQECLGEQLQ
jgi:phage shock protein A